MSEFNNRISAQRDILSAINNLKWTEELFGLSSGAIERWASANRLDKTSDLVILIYQVAEKLFFLSNKSQEQVTEEYKHLSVEVTALTGVIEKVLESFSTTPKSST